MAQTVCESTSRSTETLSTETMSLIKFTCKCAEATADKDELYLCKHEQCDAEYFCGDCGPYYHQFISKSKRKNHSFQITSQNIISLNELLEKKEDTLQFTVAKEKLTALLGIKRYNKIKKYVEKPISLGLSNCPMVIELATELTSFYKSVQKAVDAHQSAIRATSETIKQLETYNATPVSEFDWFFRLWYPNPKKEYAFKKLINAQNLQIEKAAKAREALNSTVSTNKALKAGVYGMAIATSIEMSIHSYRWFQGQINGNEWCRLLGKSVARNAASMIGTAVGAKAGAIIGCRVGITVGNVITPGVGTLVGASVGIVGGILFGYLMGKGAEAIYEDFFPQNKTEEEHKEKLLHEALLYFNFQPKDINNSRIFNQKMLKKLFRQRALNAHPDRRNGDQSEWNRLSTYYGFLKALLEQKDSDKQMIAKRMQTIQTITL